MSRSNNPALKLNAKPGWAQRLGFGKKQVTVGQREARPARMKGHELTFILQTLSTLINNGVPLPKALATLSREDTVARHRELLDTLRRKIESGVGFSKALETFPQMIDSLTVSQIRLGERSGTLAETLQHLSENRNKTAELKRTVLKKLAYPGLLITVGSGLIVFLLTYVIPVFQQVYDNAHVPLPFVTQALIEVAGVVRSYGLYLILVGAVATLAIRQLRKQDHLALAMDRFLLRLPGFGRLLRDIAIMQLMEVLHNLMAAGYTLAESVSQTASSVGNRAVRKGVQDLHLAIQRGERFSRELERHDELFPPIVNQLVIVGESTGQFTRATQDICDYLRREIERKTSLLVGALEPILTISLAAAIAVVLLAIYLPMFDMVNTMNK